MKKLIATWLLLFLSLSLINAAPVMAQEGQFKKAGSEFRPLMGPQGEGRGRQQQRRGFSNLRTKIRGEEEKVLNYLKENQPEVFEKLTRLKKSNPMKYWEVLRNKTKQVRFLERLKKKDPDRYEKVVRIGELEQKSRELAEEYKGSEDPKEKEAIKADLESLLSELFDLKQEEREAEMKRLEQELKKLQENIIRRKENKETIVNRRLKEITGESDYLQW